MSSGSRPLTIAALLIVLVGVGAVLGAAVLGVPARGAGEPSASSGTGGSAAGSSPGAAGVAAAWAPTLGNCVPPGASIPGVARASAPSPAASTPASVSPSPAGDSANPGTVPANGASSSTPAGTATNPSAGATPTPAVGAIPAGRVSTPPRWRRTSLVANVPILMYHRIVTHAQGQNSLASLEVAPSVFADQMATLAKAGWRSITMRQLAADLAAGKREPPRTVVITFDDGYRDGYLSAAPILKRYGMVGTFFVITGRVGDSDYLAPMELCQMTAQGDEIANHSVHHVDLAAQSRKRLATEIDTAASQIRKWTGIAPVTLAYPFGTTSASVIAKVRTDGYWLAVTNVEGALESWSSRFAVPRVRVGPGMSGAGLLGRLAPYAGT